MEKMRMLGMVWDLLVMLLRASAAAARCHHGAHLLAESLAYHIKRK
jgi:hypothetical protein